MNAFVSLFFCTQSGTIRFAYFFIQLCNAIEMDTVNAAPTN